MKIIDINNNILAQNMSWTKYLKIIFESCNHIALHAQVSVIEAFEIFPVTARELEIICDLINNCEMRGFWLYY